MVLAVKNPPANAGDASVHSLGWEDPLEEGMATPLQYSCLENPRERSLMGYSPRGRKASDTTEGPAHSAPLAEEPQPSRV